MRELLQAVEREARAGGLANRPDSILLLTARWPQAGEAFLNGAAAAQLVFDPPDEERSSSFRAIGFGEAARIDATGADRIASVQAAGARLFERIVERRAPGCVEAPAPRLYGGFRFTLLADAADADPFCDFADASFTLPRWLILERDDAAYLRLAVSVDELLERGAEPLSAELARLTCPAPEPLPEDRGPLTLEELPFEGWRSYIDEALARIAAAELAKVVAARRSCLRQRGLFDVATALARLGAEYPSCTRFALRRGNAVLVGATPELLIERRGVQLRADALAGSRVRKPGLSAAEEEAERHAFLLDDKELREHAHVGAAIRAVLGRYSDAVQAAPTPGLRTLRNVHHLHTPITAMLRAGDPPVHVLELVAALHPTPAVCGVPREAAARFIAEREPSPRGLYAAPIGWWDREGEGRFCVALRCALLTPQAAWLYAGAGIVAGSDPEREYRETTAKLRPMLDALGVRELAGPREGRA